MNSKYTANNVDIEVAARKAYEAYGYGATWDDVEQWEKRGWRSVAEAHLQELYEAFGGQGLYK